MTRMRNVILAVVVWLCCGAPAFSAPLDDAAAALRRGDYAKALEVIRPLAEQGNALAQYNLGVSYDLGWGVPQNAAEAIKWYRLAADQGYSLAQQNLGDIYATGRGVTLDNAEALKWYRIAADQGNSFAQNSLGLMYEKGQGVPADLVRAHMWFNLSGAQGNDTGLKNRIRAAGLMTKEQIAEAQKLARDWKPMAR